MNMIKFLLTVLVEKIGRLDSHKIHLRTLSCLLTGRGRRARVWVIEIMWEIRG